MLPITKISKHYCDPIFNNHWSCSLAVSLSQRLHWKFGSRHLVFVHLHLIAQASWNDFSECTQRSDILLYKGVPSPNRMVKSVPFCNLKLEISIFWGWNIKPSSAYCFIKLSTSMRSTRESLNNGGKFAKWGFNLSGSSMSHWAKLNNCPFFNSSERWYSASERLYGNFSPICSLILAPVL